MKDFSIIIPAYNVEKYIEKCINSVLNQTYKNFEIIIVNDGSTDNTEKILKNYKSKAIIINKENGGLSSARNTGVKYANGKYLIFLDSDDWWEKDLLKSLKENIEETKCEIISFKLQKYYEEDNKFEVVNIPSFEPVSGKEALKRFIESHLTFETAVTYAYKKDFWLKNKFSFSEGKYHEDFGLTPYVIACAKKVVSIDYVGYNYLKRTNSITSSDNYAKELKKAYDTVEHIKHLKDKFAKLKLDNYTKELLANYLMNSITNKAINLKMKDQTKIFKKLKEYKVYELFKNGSLKSHIKYLLLKINPKNYKIFIKNINKLYQNIFKFILVIICLLLGSIISFKIWMNYNINQPQIPVLMYHEVVYDDNYSGQSDTIKLSTFEKHLKYFKNNNFKTLTLDEFYEWKKEKKNVKEKMVVLTFDDGFYSFNYLVKPLLEKYGYKATNFLIGNTISETTKEYNEKEYGTIGIDLIKNNDEKTVFYESHSYGMHTYIDNRQSIYSMSDDELQADLDAMKKIDDFRYISYPYNTDTDEFIELLKENNYKMAFRGEDEKATFSVSNYQIPRIGINEDFEHFKSIFETANYNNKYGNGFIRKVAVTIERKFLN